jgi:hypothetical protein
MENLNMIATAIDTPARDNHARDAALSTAAHIARLIRLRDRLNKSDCDHYDWAEAIQQQIDELPLSVLVRSDWHEPDLGSETGGEYEILLCTGGPAVRITGPLTIFEEPEDAFLQCQDWGTPWEPVALDHETQLALQDFARNFYFGG